MVVMNEICPKAGVKRSSSASKTSLYIPLTMNVNESQIKENNLAHPSLQVTKYNKQVFNMCILIYVFCFTVGLEFVAPM